MSQRIRIENLSETVIAVERASRIARIYVPNKILDEIANTIMDRMLYNCPIGDGELKDSAYIESGPDRREIGFSAPHAIHVEEGTQGSPGRYVPAIGKRLVNVTKWNPSIGRHPGTPATHFFEKSIEETRDEVNNILDRGAEEISKSMRE